MADEQIVTNIVATSDFSSLIADVQRTTAALSKLQSQLALSNTALANQAGQIQKGFGETLRSTGQFTSHFVTVGSEVDRFGKSLDSGRLKLRDYFKTWQDHTKSSGGLIRGLAKEQVALQQSIVQSLGKTADGMQKFNVHVKTGLDEVANRTALAKKEMQIYNKVIQDGGNQIINWGKNTQWAGRQLTVGLTVPIAAFGVAASKAFRDVDQELVRLTKVYGGLSATSAVELAKVRKDVSATAKELAAAYGASYKDTIALAADIAATGKQGNELLQSTKEATRLSILGEVDRQEAMKATLAIQSAFKKNTTELGKSINFLNAVENQTSTSLADLVEAIPKAGPVVKALGGDIEDLALYLTAMREGGINASEGANALKSALASIINPTKVAKEMFQGFGIDLGGIVTKNAGNLTGTILEIQAALETLDPLKKSQAIEQLFGKFQFARMNALFENLGKQGSQTLQVLDLMKASSQDLANVAGRELAQITESASGKYRRALESLKADLAKVGEQFLTIQTFFIELVDKIINFVNKLPEPIQKVLTLLAGFTAAAGPLIMLTGVFANFFGYVIKGIGHLRALFKGGEGFKLLTPQIIAANQAGSLIEKTFYSDAQAAATLANALSNLNNEFNLLYNKANNIAPVAPAISTMASTMMLPGGATERVVNKQSSMLGKPYSRDMSHMIPSKTGQAGTMFGVLPGTAPVNKRISNNPQIYAAGDLPDVPGLTNVNKVSTGVVAAEAAKWHSMTAAIAMQSDAELTALKQEVAATGTITHELSSSYQALLPKMTEVIQKAVKESELIVAQTQSGKITLDQARAKITALNAQIETLLASTAQGVATAQGRSINVGMVPLTNQPAVSPTGKSNMKEMFHKSANANLINKIAGVLGVRTSGGGYSTETTMPKRFAEGGFVPGTGNTDTHPDSLPAGSYVVNKKSSENPMYRPILRAMKTGIRFSKGGEVPVVLTPGEFVADPQTARENAPVLRSINAGNYAVGGTVSMNKVNYGISPNKQRVKSPAIIEDALAKVIAFNTDKNYAKNNYTGAVLNDSWAIYDAITSATGRPADPKEAISIAEAMEEEARSASTFGGVLDENEYRKVAKEQMTTWKKKLKEQYPSIRLTSSNKRQNATDPTVRKLIYAMMLKDKRFSRDYLKTLDVSEGGNAVRAHRDQLSQSKNKNNPYKYLRAAVVTPTNVNYESKQLQDYYGMENYEDRVSAGPVRAEQDAKKLLKGVGFNSLSSYEKYLKEKKEKKEAAKKPKKYKEFLAARTLGKPALFTPAFAGAIRRNKGGIIPGLASSVINRLTNRWPGKKQFYPQGYQYMLGNQDPLHGPLQIGMSQQLARHSGYDPKDVSLQRGVVFRDDRFSRLNIMPQFLTGTAEDRGRYATSQYMSGNLDIMGQMERLGNHPLGPIAAMKTQQKKFSGKLFRGIKLDRTFKGLPEDLIEAIKMARVTGDASPLIGKEFIMRRSSWSKSQNIASYFAPGKNVDPESLLIEAAVKNRNILPAGDMFPDKVFQAPGGQNWGGGRFNNGYRSEQEAIFGGKFKIVGFDKGTLQVQTVVDGAREDGGPTQAGKSYIVGENGPEIFIPETNGNIVPNAGVSGSRKTGAMVANYGASMAGYGIASKLAPGNMLAQIGGGLLGDVAGNMMYNKIMNIGQAAGSAANKTSLLTKAFQFFIKMPGPVKLLAAIAGVGMAIQAVNKKIEEHRRIVNSAFGLEASTVAKLGLQYTTLEDKMKDYRKAQDLANASAAAFKYTTDKVGGAQGIDMTQEELDALKKSSKKDFKTEISMFNTAGGNEVIQKATQLKAMFVSSGMAVQDANELIYALILNSNKAESALTALGDKGFGSIQDKGTAAAATLKTYYSVIAKGNTDQIGKSVDSALNAYINLETSLVNINDKTKPIVTESEAYLKVLNKIKNSNAGNAELGDEIYLALSKQNAELGKIINTTDTFASVMAKVKLSTSGLSLDLANMGSSAATALSIVVSKQQDTLGSTTGPFAKLARDIQNTGKASADQIVKTSQISADALNKQIDLHNKNIKKIKEEADARKKALDEQLSDETTLLQIKKKQMEYADAVAAGDMSRAAQAQLDIQALTRAQEVTVAKRSIDDKAEKDIKAQEAAIDALNKKLDGLQKTVNAAQANASAAQKKSADLQSMMDELVALTVAGADGVDSKESARRDALVNKLTKAGYKDIASKITGAVGGRYEGSTFVPSGDKLAELSKGSFNDAYNASKKALAVYITDPETIALLGGLGKGETPGFQPPKGTPKTPIINPKTPVKDVSKEKTILDAAKAAAGGKKQTTMVSINDIAYEIFKYGNSQYLMPKGTSGSEIYEYLFANGAVTRGKRVTDLKRNYSIGGLVFGAGTATSDSIPAMLSNGEYVINAGAVSAYGKEVFDQFNSRKFATGGMVNPSFSVPSGAVSLGNNMGSRYNGGGQVYNYSAGGIVINPAQGQNEKQIAEYVVSIMDAKNGLRAASTGDKGRYLRT
jgi:TP901 family phage tail tape measure protein